ncbi:hypothetical protein, partial [Escherichia coli]|uniref:hypothetical protein n=1 Tax=Escherichia coli TaxID=562 RepID=UPI001BDB9EEE
PYIEKPSTFGRRVFAAKRRLFPKFRHEFNCLKNNQPPLKWPVHGTYACRNVVFEPVGTRVSIKKAHADSA